MHENSQSHRKTFSRSVDRVCDRTAVPETVRLSVQRDIIGCVLTLFRPNVSKLMSEIKVPTNVIFGLRPAETYCFLN